MSKTKVSKPNIKPTSPKQDPLIEAKTIGYMEGYSDGRNVLIKQLLRLKLLRKNWKKECNKFYKETGYLIM